jgi:ABC-type glycerol-3-phosphate transport system substrate-binding protein
MGQGKKWSQMKDSETFAFISLIAAIIMLLLILLASCNVKAQTETPDEKIFIHMSNGDKLELIADEYGNQYLKENAGTVYIYIPYPGDTEESDTLHFYNAKN